MIILEMICDATFIYFSFSDKNVGLTFNMLKKLDDFANSREYIFRFDERDCEFYIWVNYRIMTREELLSVIDEIKRITEYNSLDLRVRNIVNTRSVDVNLNGG